MSKTKSILTALELINKYEEELLQSGSSDKDVVNDYKSKIDDLVSHINTNKVEVFIFTITPP